LERLRLRPLMVGAGRGGRIGDEPPSAVELEEKAGDPGTASSDSGVAGITSIEATRAARDEDGEDEA
jgi:hypothetical protein